MEKTLNLIKNDPWLEPYKDAIVGRFEHAMDKKAELTNGGKSTLSDFASGYLYFGLHRTDKGWIFREWAPNASHIYMVGTFSNWEEKPTYKLKRLKMVTGKLNCLLTLSNTAIYINYMYTGKVVRENEFPLGLTGSCRMKAPKYSVLRYGHRRSHLNLKRKPLNPVPIHC